MTYILIIFVQMWSTVGNGASLSMQEFNSLQACEAAIETTKKLIPDKFLKRTAIFARCVEKGENK